MIRYVNEDSFLKMEFQDVKNNKMNKLKGSAASDSQSVTSGTSAASSGSIPTQRMLSIVKQTNSAPIVKTWNTVAKGPARVQEYMRFCGENRKSVSIRKKNFERLLEKLH